MSAITGICDFLAIAGSASASSWRRARDPDDVAAGGGQLGDLLQRRVDVGGQRRGHRLHGDRATRCRRRPCRPGSGGSGGAGRAPAAGPRACPGRRRSWGHPRSRGCRSRAQLSETARRCRRRSARTLTTRISGHHVGDRQQLGAVDAAGVGPAAQPGDAAAHGLVERRAMPPPSNGGSGTRLISPRNRFRPASSRITEKNRSSTGSLSRGHLAGDPAGADDAHRAVRGRAPPARGPRGRRGRPCPAASDRLEGLPGAVGHRARRRSRRPVARARRRGDAEEADLGDLLRVVRVEAAVRDRGRRCAAVDLLAVALDDDLGRARRRWPGSRCCACVPGRRSRCR